MQLHYKCSGTGAAGGNISFLFCSFTSDCQITYLNEQDDDSVMKASSDQCSMIGLNHQITMGWYLRLGTIVVAHLTRNLKVLSSRLAKDASP